VSEFKIFDIELHHAKYLIKIALNILIPSGQIIKHSLKYFSGGRILTQKIKL